MKSNQKGFSVIQIILLIIAVGIIGFTGWYVYDANKNIDSTLKPATQSNTTSKTTTKATSTSVTPKCRGSSLTLTELNRGGAAGTEGITYSVTNKSKQSCTVEGYPTVTLLDSAGKQLGHDAVPSSSDAASAITLQPGNAAYVTVLFPNPANFTDGQCDAQKSANLRLTPSGVTSSAQVALTGEQYCPGFSTQAFTSTTSQ